MRRITKLKQKASAVLVVTLCLPFLFGFSKTQKVNLTIIAKIESNNNQLAIGRSGEIGLHQISKAVLREYNFSVFGFEGYKTEDMFNTDYNTFVAEWYINYRIPQLLRSYRIKDTVENRLRVYHIGIGNVIKHKAWGKNTKDYIRKYRELEKSGVYADKQAK